MATRPKRKHPNGRGTTDGSAMGSAGSSYSAPGGVCGFSPPEASTRDGRKKRKDKVTWENFTLMPYHDGHLWRKYGQKWIKDCPFPRLYFKCSYYEDKKCMATKLLQQYNDDVPPLFKVTYIHEHTCNAAPVPAPEILAEAELPAESCDGLVLKFDSHGGGWMQQDWQCNQPMSWSPFQRPSIDDSSKNIQPRQQHAFFFDVQPPAMGASSASSSFPISESLPVSPSTNNEGDILSTWNSFRSTVEEHLFDVDFSGSTFSWGADIDVHYLDSWACM